MILLYGPDYWQEVLNLGPMATWQAIAPRDLKGITWCDSTRRGVLPDSASVGQTRRPAEEPVGRRGARRGKDPRVERQDTEDAMSPDERRVLID